MAVHHGGKVGSAARKLASKSTGKNIKSNAGKTDNCFCQKTRKQH